jgi:hypothetical protein
MRWWTLQDQRQSPLHAKREHSSLDLNLINVLYIQRMPQSHLAATS